MINKIKIFFRKIYYYNELFFWKQIQYHYIMEKIENGNAYSTQLGIRLSRLKLYQLNKKIYGNESR